EPHGDNRGDSLPHQSLRHIREWILPTRTPPCDSAQHREPQRRATGQESAHVPAADLDTVAVIVLEHKHAVTSLVEATVAYKVKNVVVPAAQGPLQGLRGRRGQNLKLQPAGLLERRDRGTQVSALSAHIQPVIVHRV